LSQLWLRVLLERQRHDARYLDGNFGRISLPACGV